MNDLPNLWVIDAMKTGDDFPPFHFYLYDPEYEVVLSYHIESDEAPEGMVVGVIHPDGEAAGEIYMKKHEQKIKAILGDKLFV